VVARVRRVLYSGIHTESGSTTDAEEGPDVTEHDTEKDQPKKSADVETGLVEKAFLMGLGAAFFAKDKAEELADELVQRGKISREDTESFTGRLVDQADSAAGSAQKTVSDETAKVVQRMGLASKADLDRLESELAEIKALIASMKPVEGGPAKP
jgi:polyhydroxyalkanoate synthesis regulator phasin